MDCIRSPRDTLIPHVTTVQAATLAYPPNALPGARDVATFWGTMRVYEWGPADGSKVLFVHGDATPCPVFADIAQTLVDAGHRVMLFDLWGRGYTDSPLHCRHDARLFATQIPLALASSQLSWTGSGNTFSIVAFSHGGPISLTFTAAFPESVRSLVLLGPAGLIRELPPGYDDDVMQHPELAPSQTSIREKVREILGVSEIAPPLKTNAPGQSPDVPSRVERKFDMEGIFQFQFSHHQGHVYSFQNTVQYGPLQHKEELWGSVCDIIAGKSKPGSPLHDSKLLVFFGDDDDVVVGTETTEEILKLLPSERLQVEYLPGGHGFPYPNSAAIANKILAFWQSGLGVRATHL